MDAKKYFPRKQLKEEGKQSLSGHWGKAIVILIIGALVGGLPSFFTGMMQVPSMQYDEMTMNMTATTSSPEPQVVLLTIIISLLGALLTAAYMMASSKWYLDLVQRNENTSIGDFFGHFRLAGKGILAYLWMSLWLFIWMLIPMAIAAGLFIGGGVVGYASNDSSAPSFILVVLGLIAFIAYMVIAVWKSYSYGQIFNVIADNPETGVREAMRHSIAMTKDYILDLFVLDLSFILWGLMVIVTLGIGILYVGPYMSATSAMAYFFLRDQALDRGILSPAQFKLERRAAEEPVITEVREEREEDQQIIE